MAGIMDEMVTAFQNSFKSQRLAYRTMEDSDKHFIHTYVFSDPVTGGLGEPSVLRSISRGESDKRVEGMASCLLAVMILAPKDENQEQPDDKIPKETLPSLQGYQPVGFLSLTKQGPPLMRIRSTSISLAIASGFQNKGYGREAINWVLDWCFLSANMHRVNIGTIEFNERAIHLYKSLGFVEEGRERKAAFFNGRWFDLISMGMLEDEYKKLRGVEV